MHRHFNHNRSYSNSHIHITTPTLKWMRHLNPPSYISDTLTNLLTKKEHNKPLLMKLLKDNKSTNSFVKPYNPSSTVNKNIKLELLFNKTTLSKIYQLRDIFLEFEEDHSCTLELRELLTMFNSNGIPITKEEIAYLFLGSKPMNEHNVLNHKFSFLDFVLFALNNENEDKFRNVMKRIKVRTTTKTFIPMTIVESLEYVFKKGKIKKNISTIQKCINKISNKNEPIEGIECKKKRKMNNNMIRKRSVNEDINAGKICKCFLNVLDSTQEMLGTIEKHIEKQEQLKKQDEHKKKVLENIFERSDISCNSKTFRGNNSLVNNYDKDIVVSSYTSSSTDIFKNKKVAIKAIQKYQYSRNKSHLPNLIGESFTTSTNFSKYINSKNILLTHKKALTKNTSKEFNILSLTKTRNSFLSQDKIYSHIQSPRVRISNIILKNDHIPKGFI